MLFVTSSVFALCVSAAPAAKPAPAKPAPAPVAAKPAPAPPKKGFWERAWDGTKSGTQKAWKGTQNAWTATTRTVTKPFGGKSDKAAEPERVWRNLAMSITLDPETIRVSEVRAVGARVLVENKGKHAVQLDFPTTQRVQVRVRDDAGSLLTQAVDQTKGHPEQGFIVINPDERLEYSAAVSTRGMQAGRSYTVEAFFPAYPDLRTTRAVIPVR